MQATSEVAAACGVSMRKIAQVLGVDGKTVGHHLSPSLAERKRSRDRRYQETNREKVREVKQRYYRTNREKVLERVSHYRKTNREKVREVKQRYHRTNQEKIRERKQRYYRTNREKVLQSHRSYYERNREEVRERNRRWCKANPDALKAISRRRNSLRRLARCHASAPLTRQQLLQRYDLFGNRCAYCGDTKKITADHVLALNTGGLDEARNIIPACLSCNSKKRISPVAEWYKRQPFFLEANWQRIQQHCPHIAEVVA
jgi:hypothetical protein